MPGDNLEAYLEECRAKSTRNALAAPSIRHLTDSEAITRINRALKRIATRLKVSRVEEAAPSALTDGVATYLRPSGRMNKLLGVRVKRADGSTYRLVYREYDWFRDHYRSGDFSQDSGEPVYYTFTQTPSGEFNQRLAKFIEIRPVPRWTLAGGLIYNFPRSAMQLERIQNQSSVKAIFTRGSADVTFDGPITFLPGDEIARIEVLQTDGTSDEDPISRTWYEVIDCTSGNTASTATLDRVFQGDSSTPDGDDFQGAQVSDVEQVFAGQILMAPAWMALADFWQISSPASARIMAQDAEAILSKVRIEEPDDQGWDYGMEGNIVGYRTEFSGGSGRTWPVGSGNWRFRP